MFDSGWAKSDGGGGKKVVFQPRIEEGGNTEKMKERRGER